MPQQILPRLDTLRDRERHLTLIRNHPVRPPRPVSVHPVFVDLEPLQPSDSALRRGGDRSACNCDRQPQRSMWASSSLQVCRDGALVPRINRIGGVAWVCTVQPEKTIRRHKFGQKVRKAYV